jgi:arsenate reductase (glutaredoxin)
MSKIVVYEKKTCITCKKALAFLDEAGVDYERKDIVQDPPSEAVLDQVIEEGNLKAAMNPRSTIYKEKNLGKATLTKKELIKLMHQDPNLIKRPLIMKQGEKQPYLGFDPDTLKAFLKK